MKSAIHDKLKSLRKKRNYSQLEVAYRLNMNQNAYSDMESGKRKLDIERLRKISALYKISLSELVDETTPPIKLKKILTPTPMPCK